MVSRKLRWLAGLLLIEVAALQALEIEAFVFAAFARSSQALGEGRVWLQECLAGTRLTFRMRCTHFTSIKQAILCLLITIANIREPNSYLKGMTLQILNQGL